MVQKTLTDVTKYTGYGQKLNVLFEGVVPDPKEIIYKTYTEEDFLNDVYIEYSARMGTAIRLNGNEVPIDQEHEYDIAGTAPRIPRGCVLV